MVIEHDPKLSIALEAAKARWTELMRATEYFMNGGWLGSSWRPLYGGKLEPIPPTDWFTEEEVNWRRFTLCRIDPRPELKFTGPPAGPAFIYVSSKSLAKLIDVLRANHPDEPRSEVAADEPQTRVLADRTPKAFSSADVDAFKAQVVAAVLSDPNEPPLGRGRDYWISQGRAHLPKRIAEAAYVEALEKAKQGGSDHGWSKQGRKSKGSQSGAD